MLDAMLDGERTIGELTTLLGVSQPAVSQHMQVLRLAGLVDERREGRHVYYRVRAGDLAVVGEWIAKYEVFWADRLDRLDAHLAKRRN